MAEAYAQNIRRRLEKKKKRKMNSLMKEKPKHRNRHLRYRPAPPPAPASAAENHPSRCIINLSGKNLTSQEIQVLSKGLTFVPQPSRVDCFKLKQDLKEFGRRVRLKEFFFHDPTESSDQMSEPIVGDTRRFRNKSTWTPPKNRIPALEARLQVVEKEALRMAKSVRRKDNLTSDEREAISNLRRRDDIVIKPADKRSTTVVLSREAYLAEAHRQLSDTKYYARLDMDPT